MQGYLRRSALDSIKSYESARSRISNSKQICNSFSLQRVEEVMDGKRDPPYRPLSEEQEWIEENKIRREKKHGGRENGESGECGTWDAHQAVAAADNLERVFVESMQPNLAGEVELGTFLDWWTRRDNEAGWDDRQQQAALNQIRTRPAGPGQPVTVVLASAAKPGDIGACRCQRSSISRCLMLAAPH